MEFEELYKKMQKFEKDSNIEEAQIYSDGIALFWIDYIDVLINGTLFLTSTIVLGSDGVEIYGSYGAKAFEFDEITEFDIDV